jgi:ribosomal protection tetracycline resistance protein
LLRRTLNLGILAHVDAGKTTLTERLLYRAGVIDEVGSVDKGTTQTDSLALERQRGITIKSAVVSFPIDDITVNLIDTPGHPDFIAEVERVLAVLDGAVLVVSAVEGVQPQTRILMRALQRLRIPTLLFVNKIDRVGADFERVLAEIEDKLTPAAAAITVARGAGNRSACVAVPADDDAGFRSRLVEVLSEHDESLLQDFVDDEVAVSWRRLREALAAQTGAAVAYPVFCGSALTGAGVDVLASGAVELLPAAACRSDGPASGLVFKIERSPVGERIAFVRMFCGAVCVRERVRFGRDDEAKVTALRVFVDGSDVQRESVCAGEIAKLWGLADVRIGDSIGNASGRALAHEFPPPTLESVVVTRDPVQRLRLHLALEQLAEQDPLISVRQDDVRREVSVSLYGEVQKEVIAATLATDYGLEVAFRETTPIYVERPLRSGEALEVVHAETNPFFATIGLRVDPTLGRPPIRVHVDPRTVPLFVYKTFESFTAHMDEYVRETLREGLFGWQVTDCEVTLTRCEYTVADGPPSRRGPTSTAADFRKLTPIVLMKTLERAGTVVCEPTVRVAVEIPADAIGRVAAALGRLGATAEAPRLKGRLAVVETVLPATRARDLERQLAGLTHGEGVLESAFEGYEPVTGEPPIRPRTTPNPLDLGEYTSAAGRAR